MLIMECNAIFLMFVFFCVSQRGFKEDIVIFSVGRFGLLFFVASWICLNLCIILFNIYVGTVYFLNETLVCNVMLCLNGGDCSKRNGNVVKSITKAVQIIVHENDDCVVECLSTGIPHPLALF